ncbi:Monofunctional C1-tetrahydrofolate synthase, mitochondrial [Bagarius yarrelli]|uniref:formate--tetrahydrofolate ligase n=1 Tax=Bagarius yarrelli TaxID=175774 RepID=A0A556V2B2_BAGYA|nr:Monofunctional C1-tetrahydrofolate synthase, mitochondrial [Bagarius yarrelli]
MKLSSVLRNATSRAVNQLKKPDSFRRNPVQGNRTEFLLQVRRSASSSIGGTGVSELSPAFNFHTPREQTGDPHARENTIREIIQRSRDELAAVVKTHPGIKPTLAIIQVIEEVLRLNEDPSVHGVFLCLPPSSLSRRVLNSIKPEKDVDGVSDLSVGRLVSGALSEGFLPPVSGAVMDLLARRGAPLAGKMAVLVGLDKPLNVVLQCLLQNVGVTVLTGRWSSETLQEQVKQADVVVLTGDEPATLPNICFKPGVTLVNCSASLIPEFSAHKKNPNAESWTDVAPISAALRMQNVVQSSRRWVEGQQYQLWKLRPLKLQPLSPVPSDIEISRAQTPKPIMQLAEEIGLLPEELEAYGRSKAKVRLSVLKRLQQQPNGKYILFNLHLTGDIHAITAANNLLAAAVDARILHEATQSDKRLGINKSDPGTLMPEEVRAFVRLDLDPEKVTWQRVVDTNDRFLRKVTVGQASTEKGHSRQGTPVFVHAGPFANIAHGNSSVLADQLALKLVGEDGYVVTEAGFGADIGMEKFFNIKCRASGLKPDAVVLVATVRALKMHGGGPNVTAGVPLPKEYTEENLKLVADGCSNLKKQIQIARLFGVPVVVALNVFKTDTEAEIELVCRVAEESGASAAMPCHHWGRGGRGAAELAHAVKEAAARKNHFHFLYNLQSSIVEKIRTIAQQVYGADDINLSPGAQAKIDEYTRQGFDMLPICMAKTHLSLSHMPEKKGVPTGFILPIRDVRASIGAGFIYPLVGAMSTMPGLPTRPCFYDIDLDPVTEEITGLF